nr:MAG TPA: hypothetical protein [Caudoviricetes sp.]
MNLLSRHPLLYFVTKVCDIVIRYCLKNIIYSKSRGYRLFQTCHKQCHKLSQTNFDL